MLQLTTYVAVRTTSLTLLSSFFPYSLLTQCRTNGTGELYAYLPVASSNSSSNTTTSNPSVHTEAISQAWNNTPTLLAVPPKSLRNPDYGFSVGRGAFTFRRGEWNVVSQRVRLNTVSLSSGSGGSPNNEEDRDVELRDTKGDPKNDKEFKVEADGEVEVRINGQTVIDVRGVVLRTSPQSTVQGLHVQSFFGGEYFCVFRVLVLSDEEEECVVR